MSENYVESALEQNRNTMPPLLLPLFLLCLGLFHFPGSLALASVPSGGTVEGRVLQDLTGLALANARVAVPAAGLESFTDFAGFFCLHGVPAGRQEFTVFFTGLTSASATIQVATGGVHRHDFTLDRPADPASRPVRLEKFVVAESPQMEGAAIAIQEQRFAANLKIVVTADEFGAASEGDIGEFLKFLPGVTMGYAGGDARQVSLGGLDSNYTPVTFAGFGMTNGNQGATNRGVALEYVSLNNVSRVEIINSPTPESPGGALAGSINFVPRTAFERVRPLYTLSTYVTMRDDARDFHRSPGPRENSTRKVLPGFEFSAVVPVSRRFGFTVSGAASTSFSDWDALVNTWRGGNAVTNGAAFPDTTPDRPYLSSYLFRDGFILRRRSSGSLTLDYQLGPSDRLAFSVTSSAYATNYDMRGLTFGLAAVAPGFSTASVRSTPGQGSLSVSTDVRDRNSLTWMPTLVLRHDGPLWRGEAGFGYSHSRDSIQSGDRGWFSNVTAGRTGLTLAFDDVTRERPGRITATDNATGRTVDPFAIESYAARTATLAVPQNTDTKRSAYGNAQRAFSWLGHPLLLKAGFDVQQAIRDDTRSFSPSNVVFDFVGADGRTSTAPAGGDDAAAPFHYTELAVRPSPFGFPAIPVVSNARLWSDYRANPGHFRSDDNTTYRAAVAASKRAEETISAAYLRGDVSFLDQRLRLVGGLRLEETRVRAEGPLSDPTRNYQYRPDGTVILGANGRPLTVAPSTNALEVSRLSYLSRGARVRKEYLRSFPSVNVAFNLRPNLIARAAAYTSIGRPDFNQYAGGITLPDTESAPGNANRIVVNNAAIKPWSARSANLALEYYFERIGVLSAAVFRRDFRNFFGTSILPATPEFLALYGLNPAEYGDYSVSTQYNLPEGVRMDGLSLNYKQALTFLPSWARGVQAFANVSTQHASGGATGQFQYSPRLANAGLSLTRARFLLRADLNHRGRQRIATLSGRGIEVGTTRWSVARNSLDVSGELRLGRHVSAFAKLRNVTDVGVDFDYYGPSTPAVARYQQHERFGALWTFGLKGTF